MVIYLIPWWWPFVWFTIKHMLILLFVLEIALLIFGPTYYLPVQHMPAGTVQPPGLSNIGTVLHFQWFLAVPGAYLVARRIPKAVRFVRLVIWRWHQLVQSVQSIVWRIIVWWRYRRSGG